VLPSVALEAGKAALSFDDEVVGRPCDSSVPPPPDGVPLTTNSNSE
jgi:hypothetical protein